MKKISPSVIKLKNYIARLYTCIVMNHNNTRYKRIEMYICKLEDKQLMIRLSIWNNGNLILLFESTLE